MDDDAEPGATLPWVHETDSELSRKSRAAGTSDLPPRKSSLRKSSLKNETSQKNPADIPFLPDSDSAPANLKTSFSEGPAMASSPTELLNEPAAAAQAERASPRLKKLGLTDLYGDNGPYQHHNFYFVMLVFFVMSLHTLVTPEFTPDVEYWCAKPRDSKLSNKEWLDEGIPREKDGSIKRCSMYHMNGTEVPCSSWHFKKTGKLTRTIRSEFNLVCDREWLIPLSNAVYFVGGLTTMPIMGGMSDKLGRQPVIYFNILTALAAGCMMLLARHFMSFVVCRFFLAFGLFAVFDTAIVLLSEIAGPYDRALMLISGFMFWGIGSFMLWIMSIYLDNWIIVQFVLMMPTALLVSGFLVVMESPRWLIARRDLAHAKKVVLAAARLNGCTVSETRDRWEIIVPELLKQGEMEEPYVVPTLGIFAMPGLQTVVFTLWFCWFVCSYMYYTLAVKYRQGIWAAVNSHLATGLVELPSCLVAALAVNKLGRRPSSAVCLLLGGILSVPSILFSGLGVLQLMTAVLCKILTTTANTILYVHTVELFPTMVRNLAFNTCCMSGRCGAILAIITEQKSRSILGDSPQLFFALFCIIGSALVLKLPETAGAIMPDTIAQAQASIKESESKQASKKRGSEL
ncbi:organic cation transporter protein-like [Ornithodoros turicata]|uniref:organic cation transporter protein-like n=1 Tax=Ornithodoros turicata TaxID=34597 RepID=UPI00313912F8